MINQEEFLKDPQKYLQVAENVAVTVATDYGGAVLMSLEEYEEYNADKIIRERIRTHSPDEALSHEAFWADINADLAAKRR
jgi:hypothetical protein